MFRGKGMSKIPTNIQIDTISPATKLLEKRRKMYEIHEAFEAQKDEYKKQQEVFRKQENEMRIREQNIQENLLKFCKFLQENEQKKLRADRRFEEEQKATEQKKIEIDELEAICKIKDKQYQVLEKKVKYLEKYENYLSEYEVYMQDAINISSTGGSDKNAERASHLTDYLQRYNTLKRSNNMLDKDRKKLEKEIDELTQQQNQFKKAKSTEIMQLSNDIKELVKKKEQLELQYHKLQAGVEAQIDDAATKNMQLGKMLIVIDNLLVRAQQVSVIHSKFHFENYLENAEENSKKKKDDNKKGNYKKDKNEDKNSQQNSEINYQYKMQVAIAKLKAIGDYLEHLIILKERQKQDSKPQQKINKSNQK